MQDDGKKHMGATVDVSRQNTFDPDAVQHKVNRLNSETNVGDAMQNIEMDDAQRQAEAARFTKGSQPQQSSGQGARVTNNGTGTPPQQQNSQATGDAPSAQQPTQKQPTQQQPQGFGTRMIGGLAKRMGLVDEPQQQMSPQQPQQGQVAPPQQKKTSGLSPTAVADKALGMVKEMEGKGAKQPQGQQPSQEPQGHKTSILDRLNPTVGFSSEQQQSQQEQVAPPERKQQGFVSVPKQEESKAPTKQEQATNLAVQGGMAYVTRGQSLQNGSGAAVAGQVTEMQKDGGPKGIEGMDKAELAKALGAANGAKSAGVQQGGQARPAGPPATPNQPTPGKEQGAAR